MNRIIAISLLFLFLFHQLGYYFFYVTTKYQINKTWEQKLEDRLLMEQKLNYLALPLSFPYQRDQALYQTTNESLEFGGEFYRVIKKRYASDTLHILYVNDIRAQNLKKSFKEWLNTIYQEKNPDSKSQIVLNSFDKNFFVNLSLIFIVKPVICQIERVDYYSFNYSFQYYKHLEHPPQLFHFLTV